ncbi:MAG: small multi-drug export protein [Clostridiales bacterium]|nr:small multi-drug export protein [Clostridiales bacterium]
MKESIMQLLETWFGNSHALVVLIGSAIPITEMRATIPAGILVWGLNPWLVMFLGFLGALLPVPFLLLFFSSVLKWLHKFPALRGLTQFIDNKIQKNVHHFEKSSEAALILFVAIPLPGTGLWTGSAVASFLGFKFWRSFACVAAGGALSAIVLTVLSVFFSAVL